MNKPQPTEGKSLEEILASIRKSLADEPPSRQPQLPVPPAKAKLPEAKPAQPAPAAAPAKAEGAGSLAGKLAAGLNGASSTPPASDDDLSELLATAPTKPVAPAPVDAPKPPEARSNAKDPLWFLSRLSAATDAAPAGSAARARDAAKAPAAPADEVKLSRPETLRPSLPPLFGAGSEPIPPAAPRPDIENVSLTARTEPRSIAPEGDAEPTTAKVQPEPTVRADVSAPPAAIEAPVTPPPGPRGVDEPVAKDAPLPSSAAPSAAATSPQPPAEVVPVVPAVEIEADRPEQAPAAQSAPVASTEPPSAAPAFEQAVGQLLEPVIRQWLQSNLPRLIDKAVREEVARALAAERDAAKG
jgi:cell pole-organizing protein PopZ